MKHRLSVCPSCIYAIAVGAALLVIGWIASDQGNTAGATVLFTLGGGMVIAAPFFSRLEGTFRIGPLELTLQKQVMRAVQSADDESLEGLLPLVSRDDLTVRKLKLPTRFHGHRLVDPELSFIRKKLKLSVIAVRLPEADRWRAGGQISELELTKDSELLVAGHPDSLAYLAMLIASDDDDLWKQVT
jgi:hypothetical protein